MTLAEFASLCNTPVCAKSAFNGKTLCYKFESKKHATLGEREVLSVWAEIQTNPHCRDYAQSVIMVYVDGRPECDKTMVRKKGVFSSDEY